MARLFDAAQHTLVDIPIASRRLLVTAIIGGMGCLYAVADDPIKLTKDQAIERVEQLRGEVRIDGEKPGEPIWAVEFASTAITNDDLRVLTSFPELESLNLAETAITDAGLVHVAACRNLRELNLSATKITDAGLVKLANLRELVTLDLSRTAVTDEGLLQLARLRKLQPPNVVETKVTEPGLVRLADAIRNSQADPTPPEAVPPNSPVGPLTASRERPFVPTVELTKTIATGLHAVGRAALLAARGDVAAQKRAIALLEESLENDPDNDLVRIDLADGLALLDDELAQAAAIDLYEDVLERQPEDDRLLARLARTYAALENADDAYRYAELRLRVVTEPVHIYDVARQVAAIAAATEEVGPAQAMLQEMIAQHPKLEGLRLIHAMLLVETDRAAAEATLLPIVAKYPPPHRYGVEAKRLLANGQ